MRETTAPTPISANLPQASAPGDVGAAGTTGAASDSGHIHPREPAAGIPPFLVPAIGSIGDLAFLATTFIAYKLYLIPVGDVRSPLTLIKLMGRVVVQSGNYDVALLSTSDRVTWTRVVSSGSTAVPAAANPTSLATLNGAMTPGPEYYWGIVFDNALATMWAARPNNIAIPVGYALAATFPIPASVTGVSRSVPGTDVPPHLYGAVTGGESF